MSQQQVLIVTRVALFQIVDGRTTEKGNCACAIVASAGTPPRYSMVCYNDARETLCTAAIGVSNDHSVQFQLQVNDYASFRDDKGNKWSMMFLKSAQLDKFLAVLGAAFYGVSGSPTHTTVIGDFSPPRGDAKVTLQHRVKVRFTAFALRLQSTNGLYVVEDILETNGDRQYNFQPTQSAMAREDAKGFESCCLGMSEESTRAIVVPASAPRAGRSPYPSVDVVVFVVQVMRILADVSHVEGSDSVPGVFGGGGNSSSGGALVLAGSVPTVALDPARPANPTASPAPVLGSSSSSSSSTFSGVGSGIPAEHMMMIQRTAAQINTATTTTKDLGDRIVALATDWKQVTTRPKPSTLTSQGLEQAVKQLILEHDRVRDELVQRDDLIRTLDERNRDLQKRVDTAAMVAQQLMDEKNKTVSTTSDMKLEKDRTIMKLQEMITQASNERDDVHRHLQTVKKLLEVSDAELRDTRGRIDVHNVQAQSLAGKLDVSEDALAEERSRRKALEAKVQALQDEIRQGEADLHVKSASVEELNRKADSERSYHAQLMEDERQRRQFEAQQLRSEIVTELQQREAKFQADRARVAEDNFKRGHDEGKQIGRNHARIDVEARMEELVLDAQRARTELDAYKTELRNATEEAMAENRRLESIVLQLKKLTDEATRKKAQGEFQLHGLRLKVRSAEDALMLSMTSVAHRLTRPATAEDLLSVLTALKAGENPRLQFLVDAHLAEQEAAYARRYSWIAEDAGDLYAETIANEWNDYARVTRAAKAELQDTIASLWAARDADNIAEVHAAESGDRGAIVRDMEDFFIALDDWRASLLRQQSEMIAEESSSRNDMERSSFEFHLAFLRELQRVLDHQRSERDEAEATEQATRTALELSLHEELHRSAGAFMDFLQQQAQERDAVKLQEGEGRSSILSDEDAEFSWFDELRKKEALERKTLDDECHGGASALLATELTEWQQIIREHETKIFAELIEAQQLAAQEEESARSAQLAEEDVAFESEVLGPAAAERRVMVALEQIARALDALVEDELNEREGTEKVQGAAFAALQREEADELDELKSVTAGGTKGGSALNRNSVQHVASPTNRPAASDPLLGGESNTRTSIVEEKKQRSAFAVDSDSDDEPNSRKPAAVPPSKKPSAPSASPQKSVAAATLFGSDSDSDAAPKPKAPPKKAARKVVPKKAQLFDSDED